MRCFKVIVSTIHIAWSNYTIICTRRIGTGIYHSIKEVAEIIGNEFGLTPSYTHSGSPGAQKKEIDIRNLIDLGFNPKIFLKQGIKEVIEWKQNHGN